MAVVVVAVASALFAGLAACTLLPLTTDSSVSYEVDQRVLADWQQKLGPALADLNALSHVPGLEPQGPARVSSCSVDSGQLFDLNAGRSWRATDPGRTLADPPATVTPRTARGLHVVINRLRAAGWRVTATEDNLDMDLPPGLTYDTAELTRSATGVKNSLTLQVFDDGLLAGLSFDGAKKACREE